jgi:hypothetical protein
MGSATIIVPPDLRVECDGDSIVASFEIDRDAAHTPRTGA